MAKALVLGGGGITGIAWHIGILSGAREAGHDLTAADLVVGTSAGAIVGTHVAAGTPLTALLESQLNAPKTPPPPETPAAARAWWEEHFGAIISGRQLEREERARMGRDALLLAGDEAQMLGLVSSTLGVQEWPERRLLITTVDTSDGAFVVWDRLSGAPLPEAVASSCVVPGLFPPQTIGDRRYIDGGVRSPTNADLAKSYEDVVIIAPLGGDGETSEALRAQTAILRDSGARSIKIIVPDAAANAAIGLNRMDPGRRADAARAGLRQGRAAFSKQLDDAV